MRISRGSFARHSLSYRLWVVQRGIPTAMSCFIRTNDRYLVRCRRLWTSQRAAEKCKLTTIQSTESPRRPLFPLSRISDSKKRRKKSTKSPNESAKKPIFVVLNSRWIWLQRVSILRKQRSSATQSSNCRSFICKSRHNQVKYNYVY